MENHHRIMVVGAGWLGTPLALRLIEQGHQVWATCRDRSKHTDQPQLNWTELDLSQSRAQEKLEDLLAANGITHLIGCFPPGFRQGNGEYYAKQWQKVCQAAKHNAVQKIVMISSTSVYPDRPTDMHESQANLALTAHDADFSNKAIIMLQAEQALIDSGMDHVILRCSGLIGPRRNPARFVSKLSKVSRQAPANMLHLSDAIGASLFALSDISREVVNVSTPQTVSKAEFYQAALNKSGLNAPLPPCVDSPDKRIVVDKLLELGYQFTFENTLDAL